MDDRSRKIISILQQNGKATLSEIAVEVGLSAMGVKKQLFALIFAEDCYSLESVSLEKCSLRAQPG